MGQNKIESDFRTKLNAREIEPAAASWDKLSSMLDAADEKKSKKNYTWLYIAAGITGFILLATIFFNREKYMTVPETSVVIENTEKIEVPAKDSVLQIQNPILPIQKNNAVAVQTINPKSVIEANVNPIKENRQQIAAIQEKNPENQSIIKNEQKLKSPIADAAVDELLASVEPSPTETPKKSALKVDPNSLLSQVDGELELSFREKVIHSVSKNYKNVKVALANRNLE